MRICPKCGYERRPADDDFVSPSECPKCGVIYDRVISASSRSVVYALPSRNESSRSIPDLQYTGFWARVGAALIDGVLTFICVSLLILLLGSRLPFLLTPLDPFGEFFISYLFPAVATILFWVEYAATPGKMAISSVILDAKTGTAPSVGQFVGRYFAYTLSGLFFGLGFLWVVFDSRKQGWHDKLAGTVVVRKVHQEPVVFR